MSEHYPSDLTDGQWQLIRPLLPKRAKRGRPPIDRREILDAVLYVVRTGCQWRQLPLDFPKWKTVYTVFRRWRMAGVWEQIHNVLRQRVRRSVGKRSKPTAAILDSQSVRTAEGGEQRGYDAGKKITGRKRHLAVDTLGLVWAVVVHGADWQDHEGAHFVLMLLNQQCRRLQVVFADSAVRPTGAARLGSHDLRLALTNGPPAGEGQRVRGVTEALDRGTHVLLDRPPPPTCPGLRTEYRNQRSHDPHRHDQPHDSPTRPTKLI